MFTTKALNVYRCGIALLKKTPSISPAVLKCYCRPLGSEPMGTTTTTTGPYRHWRRSQLQARRRMSVAGECHTFLYERLDVLRHRFRIRSGCHLSTVKQPFMIYLMGRKVSGLRSYKGFYCWNNSGSTCKEHSFLLGKQHNGAKVTYMHK